MCFKELKSNVWIESDRFLTSNLVATICFNWLNKRERKRYIFLQETTSFLYYYERWKSHGSFSTWCCNLSVGVALNVWFTTNGMCAKKNNHIYVARTSNNTVIAAWNLCRY